MNAIEALQLALSKPGTKVRPVGTTDWYSYSTWGVCLHRKTCRVHVDEIVNSDGTPVQWEEAE